MGKLSQRKLEQAIFQKETIRALIGARARFLASCRVADYVVSERIDNINLEGLPSKAPASIFFKDQAEFLVRIEGHEHHKAFNVSLFDTFIVIELAPGTLETEFLILVPNVEERSGSSVLDGMAASVSMVDILDALNQAGDDVGLLGEAGEILAALTPQANENHLSLVCHDPVQGLNRIGKAVLWMIGLLLLAFLTKLPHVLDRLSRVEQFKRQRPYLEQQVNQEQLQKFKWQLNGRHEERSGQAVR